MCTLKESAGKEVQKAYMCKSQSMANIEDDVTVQMKAMSKLEARNMQEMNRFQYSQKHIFSNKTPKWYTWAD